MKTTVVYVPKAGLPSWKPPVKPDSVLSKWMRRGLVTITFLAYGFLLFAYLMGFYSWLNPFQVIFLGFVPLVMIILADIFIRPGNRDRKLWIGLAVLLSLCGPGLLVLFILSILCLGGLMWKSMGIRRAP